MKEKKIKSLEGYGEFRELCFPFLLEEEYPGWTGEEKWGIVTDLSEDALLEEYPKIMEALSPYLMKEGVEEQRRAKASSDTTKIRRSVIRRLYQKILHRSLRTGSFLKKPLPALRGFRRKECINTISLA